MITTQCVDQLYQVILESDEDLTDPQIAQIANALWLLHKLFIQDELSFSQITMSKASHN